MPPIPYWVGLVVSFLISSPNRYISCSVIYFGEVKVLTSLFSKKLISMLFLYFVTIFLTNTLLFFLCNVFVLRKCSSGFEVNKYR